jgi:TPR repeat protein
MQRCLVPAAFFAFLVTSPTGIAAMTDDPQPSAQETEICGRDKACLHSMYLNRASPRVLERFALTGDAQAAMFLGMAYLVGGHVRYSGGSFAYDVPISVEQFIRFNELAVKNGSTEALKRLIYYYVYGLDYFKLFDADSVLRDDTWRRDEDAACLIVDRSAEDLVLQSGAVVLYIAGQCYLGRGDTDLGISYLTVAAKNYDSAPAAKLLSEIYLTGKFGVERSPKESSEWLSTYTALLQKPNPYK